MTIKVIHPDGRIEYPSKMSFKQLRQTVGGFVQVVPVRDEQVCMDEEGLLKGYPLNPTATALYRDTVNTGRGGAVGVWVVLTGKDRLR